MRRFFLSLIPITLLLAIIIAVDYFTLGITREFTNSILGIEEVYVHGDDTISLYSFTSESNTSKKLSLVNKKDGYKFTSGNDHETNLLNAHAVVVDGTVNGALFKGFESISFTVKINAINKLYVTAGYTDFDKTIMQWYDTNGKVYNSPNLNSETPVDDVTDSLRVVAQNADTYEITFFLDNYYVNKDVSVRNAFVAIAYVGNETITINNLKYDYSEEDVIHTESELTIYTSNVVFEDRYDTIKVLGGNINTNKKIERVFVSSVYGSFDVDFTTTIKYGESHSYYYHELKSNFLGNVGWFENVTATVDVYVVYENIPYKILTDSVFIYSGWTDIYV